MWNFEIGFVIQKKIAKKEFFTFGIYNGNYTTKIYI